MASKLNNLSLKNKKMELEQFPILKEFEVVFCDKISLLPPKRYLDFSIDLISFSTLVSIEIL